MQQANRVSQSSNFLVRPDLTFCEQRETSMTTHGLMRIYGGQVLYLIACVIWNIAGVVLLSQGRQALGPTATLVGAVVMVAIGIVAYFGLKRSLPLYIVACVLMGLGGSIAVVQAVTGDPSLWPSEFWRWAGAALNAVGFALAVIGIVLAVRAWRRKST